MSATATRKSKTLVTDEELRRKVIDACAALQAIHSFLPDIADWTGTGDWDDLADVTILVDDLSSWLEASFLRPAGEPGDLDEDDAAYNTDPLRVEIWAREQELFADWLEHFHGFARRAREMRETAKKMREAGTIFP